MPLVDGSFRVNGSELTVRGNSRYAMTKLNVCMGLFLTLTGGDIAMNDLWQCVPRLQPAHLKARTVLILVVSWETC